MAQQSTLSAFIAELRRRRVFRVAAFYGGIAFVTVRVIHPAEVGKSEKKSRFAGH